MSAPEFDIVVCHGPRDDEVLDYNIKWILFFIITTIIAIPGLLIINKGTKSLVQKH